MSVPIVSFDVAGLSVEVRSALPEVALALEAMWRPALLGTTSATLVYEVDEDGFVSVNGNALPQACERSRIAPLIEGDVLGALADQSRSSLVLHSGAVLFGEQLLLFIGEANAGKSTLTRAALRRGANYLTDDTLVFDGGSCRGLARSIHFDSFPVAELMDLPAYFADCDLESYRFLARDGRIWITPIWHGSFETVHRHAPEAGKTVLVVIERGEESKIHALSPLERAAALVGASLAPTEPDWGLVPAGPSFRLTWNYDPDRLLGELLERIGAPS